MMAEPVATPVTTPAELTVATAVLALLQVPPVDASLNVEVCPGQTVVVPVMAEINELTVTTLLALLLQPCELVTV